MLSHSELAIKHPVRFQNRIKRLQKSAFSTGMMAGAIASLRAGDICVDGGAHIGRVSDRFLDKGAIVYGFEPDPFNIKKLKLLFSDQPRFHLTEAALSVDAGTANLLRREDFELDRIKMSESSSVFPKSQDKYVETDHVVVLLNCHDALESILAEHGHIAILKLDIEGAELDILEELVRTDIFDRIRVTIVETHERHIPESTPRFAKLRDLATRNPDWGLNLDWI